MLQVGKSEVSATRARSATLAVFAGCGLIMASWAARLPDVKEQLHLSAGRLSLVLLAMSVGAMIALPAGGSASRRWGSARCLLVGAVVAAGGMISAALCVDRAAGLSPLIASLFVFGLGFGMWDVCQNIQGSDVERALARSTLPLFHAGYSAATVVAVLVGALASALRTDLVLHLGVMTVLTLVIVFWAVRSFLTEMPGNPEQTIDGQRPRSAWLEIPILAIGVVALCAAFAEGTAMDWLPVAFVEGYEMPAWLGVLALGVFMVFMTTGRVLGTQMVDRVGHRRAVALTLVLACVGAALVRFGAGWLSLLGCAVWGLGCSLGFPVAVSLAAEEPGRAPVRVSVVSTLGYCALLGGPPLVGWLGDRVGVLDSLIAVVAAAVLAIFVLPLTRGNPLPRRTSAPTQ